MKLMKESQQIVESIRKDYIYEPMTEEVVHKMWEDMCSLFYLKFKVKILPILEVDTLNNDISVTDLDIIVLDEEPMSHKKYINLKE